MAQAYVGTRISPHIVRDNAGFLIATAPICRSGWQDYRRGEIEQGSNDDRVVRVFRPVSEVTSKKTIASGEGKPIVSPHPPQMVTPDNWSWTAKGHVQNVRVGPRDKNGDVTLLADLHIQDVSLINKIAAGTRDLSCGYTYDLVTQPDGSYAMRNIKLNHVAVVDSGRAGTTQIFDSRMKTMTDEERETLLHSIAEGIQTLLRLAAAEEDREALVHRSAADTRTREQRAADAAWWKQLQAETTPDDPSDMAKHFHRRSIKDGVASYEAARNKSAARRARDSSREGEDWFAAQREAGRKMREEEVLTLGATPPLRLHRAEFVHPRPRKGEPFLSFLRLPLRLS